MKNDEQREIEMNYLQNEEERVLVDKNNAMGKRKSKGVVQKEHLHYYIFHGKDDDKVERLNDGWC